MLFELKIARTVINTVTTDENKLNETATRLYRLRFKILKCVLIMFVTIMNFKCVDNVTTQLLSGNELLNSKLNKNEYVNDYIVDHRTATWRREEYEQNSRITGFTVL